MRELLCRFFGVLPIGSLVRIDDDLDNWGDMAGRVMEVTDYCSFQGRVAYKLDGMEKAIFIKDDFEIVRYGK